MCHGIQENISAKFFNNTSSVWYHHRYQTIKLHNCKNNNTRVANQMFTVAHVVVCGRLWVCKEKNMIQLHFDELFFHLFSHIFLFIFVDNNIASCYTFYKIKFGAWFIQSISYLFVSNHCKIKEYNIRFLSKYIKQN